MRVALVVEDPPLLDDPLRVVQIHEAVLVEAFVPETPVERLDHTAVPLSVPECQTLGKLRAKGTINLNNIQALRSGNLKFLELNIVSIKEGMTFLLR